MGGLHVGDLVNRLGGKENAAAGPLEHGYHQYIAMHEGTLSQECITPSQPEQIQERRHGALIRSVVWDAFTEKGAGI